MATLRYNPNQDGPTARFLYAILKQLDHRSVDWAAVAEDVECTNGHAARMRFSRFKQHMEGAAPEQAATSQEKPSRQTTKITKRKKKQTTTSAPGRRTKKKPSKRATIKEENGADAAIKQESQEGILSEEEEPNAISSKVKGGEHSHWASPESIKDEPDQLQVKHEVDGAPSSSTSAPMNDMEALSTEIEMAAVRENFLDACRETDFLDPALFV